MGEHFTSSMHTFIWSVILKEVNRMLFQKNPIVKNCSFFRLLIDELYYLRYDNPVFVSGLAAKTNLKKEERNGIFTNKKRLD